MARMQFIPQNQASFALPMPLFASTIIATAVHEDETRFTLQVGLSAEDAANLKALSCDTTDDDLQKFTSDHERFCLGSYEAWYAKGRVPFVLKDEAGALAGFIWFGPKGDGDTFAIRLYHPYRGKRMSFPFARFVIDAYRAKFPDHQIWLETNADNVAGLGLYHKLGFIDAGLTDGGRIKMILA